MKIDRPKFKEIDAAKVGKFGHYDIVEPKMDGIWGVFHLRKDGRWTIYSRTGKEKKTGRCIARGHEITLLGEYMIGSHWAKKHECDGLFYAFDMIKGTPGTDGGGGYDLHERKIRLARAIDHIKLPSFMRMLDFQPIKKWKNMWDVLVLDKGYEGLVFKKLNERYADATWARMKHKAEIDYICMGFNMGREDGKYKDTVGSITGGLYKSPHELAFAVCKVGGLTDAQRDFFNENKDYFIGRVFTAHGFCFYPSGAIRHPKFKNFRIDKTKEDCTFDQIPESVREK